MNILLVAPDAPDSFWTFKSALKLASKKAIYPPLGLLTVAAMLPTDWNLKLIDMAVQSLRDRHIRWADYVFISAMFVQKKAARLVIDRCKRLHTPTVAGGPLFTELPEEFEDVDHLVLGEAEVALPAFLDDLRSGTARHLYQADRHADIKDTPMPLWHLAKMKKYASMCVQYSRGCPFNCDFCDVTRLFGHKMRTKTKEQVTAELESLYKTGWRGRVFIVDDNFIGNKKPLKDHILPAITDWMRKRKYPFAFNTQASVNIADDDQLMALMAQAGFDCVFIGIESSNESSLAECNKVQNTGRDLVSCVKKVQSFGMEVQGGFILGFDSDKTSIFDSTIRFIQQSGIVTAMVGLLNAPRGTALYKRLVEEKRLLRHATGDNTDFSINFIPKMKYEDLMAGYHKVVETIYSPRCYYERIRTFLKNYQPCSKAKVRVTRSDLKAFFRSMWYLGIVHRGRIYYWRLVFWAMRHPRYFHIAVTLAIYGFHFRTFFAAGRLA